MPMTYFTPDELTPRKTTLQTLQIIARRCVQLKAQKCLTKYDFN